VGTGTLFGTLFGSIVFSIHGISSMFCIAHLTGIILGLYAAKTAHLRNQWVPKLILYYTFGASMGFCIFLVTNVFFFFVKLFFCHRKNLVKIIINVFSLHARFFVCLLLVRKWTITKSYPL
jgi:hypothetical protein